MAIKLTTLPGGPPPVLKWGYFLTVGQPSSKHDGKRVAICSDGSPQFGHSPVTILSVELVGSIAEAKAWYRWVRRTKPWLSAANAP